MNRKCPSIIGAVFFCLQHLVLLVRASLKDYYNKIMLAKVVSTHNYLKKSITDDDIVIPQ